MRIIVFPDIHGRTQWKKVVESEEWDIIVFLGDLVASHEGVPSDTQLSNLEDILDLKERYPNRIFILRGNHDVQHIEHDRCLCCYNPSVAAWFDDPANRDRYMNDSQWVFVHHDIIFSHAGITNEWFNANFKSFAELNNEEDGDKFRWVPIYFGEGYGDLPNSSCIVVRPWALVEDPFKDFTQVVGHTTMNHIIHANDKCKLTPSQADWADIWFCDTRLKECLIIDDGKFEVIQLIDDEA